MALLYALSDIRTAFLDAVAMFFTTLGGETVVVAIVCMFYWCVNKRVGVIAATGWFISGLLVQGLKVTLRVERPWVIDPAFQPVAAALPGATGYSFPSGHTQSGTALFGSLGLQSRNKWVLACCCAAFFLVGLSRMYLGVHTPLDVFVSMLLTFLVCGLTALWFRRRDLETPAPTALAVFAACSAGVMLYAVILERSGVVAPENSSDCVSSCAAGLAFSLGLWIEQRWIDFSAKTPKLWMQPLKLLLGLAAAIAIKKLFAIAFGDDILSRAIGSFLTVGWIICVYPFIIKRFFQGDSHDVSQNG